MPPKEWAKSKLFWQIGAIIILLFLVAGVVSVIVQAQTEGDDSKILSRNAEGDVLYTVDNVGGHHTDEDCWLIVDDYVFDVTEAASNHPGMFHCGEDASENYHANHGAEIRPQMMVFKIGAVDWGAGLGDDLSVEDEAAIEPFGEVFVDRTWDTTELMAVIERDQGSVLFIDSSVHESVGRVSGLGFQPHTQVFSPDGVYTYVISRDGWLTQIDMRTLEPVNFVRVAKNSRGTGLTDSGEILAVGNYVPGSVTLLDAETLEIIKTIELFDRQDDGTLIRSRAGAIVEDGEKIIVALKDVNSVWVIDTSKRGMPVEEYFWGVGGEGELHDGFLTADGRYFVLAAQETNRVWVLDTETMQVVTEVETGEKPHTGPGATWGNTVFIPALGEGEITAIDTNTWERVASIPASGPGLFVRSYPQDPSYPYVWGETAFGDFEDEIYVIDGATFEIVETLVPVEGKRSIHPEFTKNGQYVYVAIWTGDEIYVYDANTFEIVTTIEAFAPSGISNVGARLEEFGL